MKNVIIVMGVFLFLFSVSDSYSQDEYTLSNEIIKEVKETVTNIINENEIPGLAIAVVNDHEILWSLTHGNLNTPDSKTINMESIFSLQSMTKSFTALAVLVAVQDGLLDLDTPISVYLPDLKLNSRYEENPENIITLRHLLTHRSGILHEAPFGNNYDLEYDFKTHIESISGTWLQFPVGYCVAYSNSGIDLAGYIVEVVCGMPYTEYLLGKVLIPLGMTNSSVDFRVIKENKNRVIGHWERPELLPVEFSMIPSGGLYSSLNDMAKYLMFHINCGKINGHPILNEDLMKEFHSIQFPMQGQRKGYALGLIHEDISNTFSIYHAGAGFGFSGWLGAYPELKLGIVILISTMPRNLREDTFSKIINEEIVKQFGPNQPPQPLNEKMILLSKTDPRVKSVIGRYGSWEKAPEISIKNKKIKIFLFNKFFPIEFYDDNGEMIGLFGGDKYIVKFLPKLGDQNGAIMCYRRYDGDSNWNYFFFNDSPFDEPGPNKPEWEKYLGEYESKYHESIVLKTSITRRNGYLYLGELKMTEHIPGLFFTSKGYPIDFRTDQPTVANLIMKKIN